MVLSVTGDSGTLEKSRECRIMCGNIVERRISCLYRPVLVVRNAFDGSLVRESEIILC